MLIKLNTLLMQGINIITKIDKKYYIAMIKIIEEGNHKPSIKSQP